ncbi:hypothetical protein BDQ12DRAFT_598866 [Crucibulum laeve]|uniref:Uncharacterized protein n=1 Tax=Crucibulum laeve TaxID=68775 RepID=A0A5C3MAC8_9AGAR|nr:hypothetical protein BDQ12DRAFT_598866 [Crucibulum laeve]
MFENSIAAGVAGNQQWGLDASSHMDGWNPYLGLPSHWNHKDRDESDSEVTVSTICRNTLISSS